MNGKGDIEARENNEKGNRREEEILYLFIKRN